ncbi:MAG: sortase [Candidatus Berkelbacteria bacterium]|nr:sortase [Candidatus Berkelbacteria bacterium]
MPANNSKAVIIFIVAILIVGGGWFAYYKIHSKISSSKIIEPSSQSAIVQKGVTSTKKIVTTDVPQATNTSSTGSTSPVLRSGLASSDLLISIDKINISAPVKKNVDGNNQELYMKALQNGVALLAGSVLPGEVGNSVIFGHSSYYRSQPGSFKTVFAKLNNLIGGDEIKISIGSSIFSYKVYDKKIVAADDISVASQSDKSLKKLTLITCWPVGTSNQRLVVFAKE